MFINGQKVKVAVIPDLSDNFDDDLVKPSVIIKHMNVELSRIVRDMRLMPVTTLDSQEVVMMDKESLNLLITQLNQLVTANGKLGRILGELGL